MLKRNQKLRGVRFHGWFGDDVDQSSCAFANHESVIKGESPVGSSDLDLLGEQNQSHDIVIHHVGEDDNIDEGAEKTYLSREAARPTASR